MTDILALVLFQRKNQQTIRKDSGMANFSNNNSMKLKISIVAIVLSVLCSLLLIGRLFYLQIIQGDKYKQLALNQQLIKMLVRKVHAICVDGRAKGDGKR